MAVDTKLTTVQNGVLGVREAIKDIDPTLAGGSITTLGDDIRTLNNRKYVYKWMREGQEVSNTTTGTLSKSDFSSSDYTEQSYNANDGVGYLTIPVSTYSDWSVTITKINGGDNYPCIYNLSNTYGPYSTMGAPVINVGNTKTISKADYPSATSVYVCGYWSVGNSYKVSPRSYDAFMNWMTLTITYSVTTTNTIYSYSLQRDANNTDNIAANKYKNDTSIISVILPENIKTVKTYAFNNCTNLEYIHFCNVNTIGDYAFGYVNNTLICKNLSNITGLDNISTLGRNCFAFAANLNIDVNLPNLSSMDISAFANSGIISVSNLGKIASLSTSSFSNCKSLVSVILPNTLTSIGNNVFYTDSNLISVSCNGTITSINQHAFNGCNKLSSIFSLESITDIQSQGFQSTFMLELDLNLPNLQTIGAYAFTSSGIKTIQSLGSITSLPNNVFQNCTKLTSAIVPSTITAIGSNAFWGCSALTTLTINASTPPTFGSAVLNGTSSLTAIYVPAASVDAYKDASGWSAYASKIQAIP